MLRGLLMEDPCALWRHNKKSSVLSVLAAEYGGGMNSTVMAQQLEDEESEHRARFLSALENINLVPMADPNTASQTERYLKCMALRQMAETDPAMDITAVDKRIMKIMGIDDGDSLFKPPPPPGAQPPNPEQELAEAAVTTANSRMLDSQTRAKDSQTRAVTAAAGIQSKEKVASLGVAKDITLQKNEHDLERQRMEQDAEQDTAKRGMDLGVADLNNKARMWQTAASARDKALDRSHQFALQYTVAAGQHRHDLASQSAQHGHDLTQQAQQHQHEQTMQENEPEPPPTPKGVAG